MVCIRNRNMKRNNIRIHLN